MWTPDKIAALAPDASTEKRGRGLANLRDWSALGTDGQYIWGLCKGSGTNPYRTQIDTHAPAFACSCPVAFKPPCKHALGLFFLWAQQPDEFAPTVSDAQPDWVRSWIEKRAAKEAKKAAAPEKTPEAQAKSDQAKAKRWEKRLELMQSGMEELELWLTDLIRQGFANVDIFNVDFWYKIATRMVDAKLPRISSYLKETREIIIDHDQWTDILMARLGELYLLVQTFKNRDKLSESQLSELLNAVGVTIQKSEVLEENAAVTDQWLVMGVKEDTDVEGRPFRRTWLRRGSAAENALILDYTFGTQGYEQHYVVGMWLQGELTYYPAHYAQRALLANAQTIAAPVLEGVLRPFATFAALQKSYAEALSRNPWLISFPAVIANVLPSLQGKGGACLYDTNRVAIELTGFSKQFIFRLLAWSGGQPLCIFGEWNGTQFEPLSVCYEGQLLPVQEQIIPAIHTQTL